MNGQCPLMADSGRQGQKQSMVWHLSALSVLSSKDDERQKAVFNVSMEQGGFCLAQVDVKARAGSLILSNIQSSTVPRALGDL